MDNQFNTQELLLILRSLENYLKNLKQLNQTESIKNEIIRTETLYKRIGDMSVS